MNAELEMIFLRLKDECKKCKLLKQNGGSCEGKKNGVPCLGFKPVED